MVDLSLSALPPAPPPPRATEPGAPQPTMSGQVAPERRGRTDSWPFLAYAIAVIPIGLLAVLALAVPAFVAPLGDDRVSLVGLPVGYFVIGLLVTLTVIGILTVRFVRHPLLVGAVLTLTTLLSLTVVAFAPAFITIAINLKT